jgi:hypothetical protein
MSWWQGPASLWRCVCVSRRCVHACKDSNRLAVMGRALSDVSHVLCTDRLQVATRDGQPPVEAFRALVGPRDPELGRVLR